MSRESFLKRVREAALRGRSYRVTQDESDRNGVDGDVTMLPGYMGHCDDLCQRMADEVNLVGGQAVVVDDHAAAVIAFVKLLKQYQPKSVFCWQHSLLDQLQITDTLLRMDIEPLNYETLKILPQLKQREMIFSAEMGVTSADFAIAETGTLAVFSGPSQERLTSLVPPVHVAIVQENQILADLYDLFARLENLKSVGLSSNLSLITGPSKTGDIDLKLTTKVHGPGNLHLIIIRDEARRGTL